MTVKEWVESRETPGMYGLSWFDAYVWIHPPLKLVLLGVISKEAPAFKDWLRKQPKTDREFITDLLKNWD